MSPTPTSPTAPVAGARDFDFLLGRWIGRNRRLMRPLTGSTEWVEFEGAIDCRAVMDGAGQAEEFRTDFGDGIVAATFRLFDPRSGNWSLFWANAHYGMILPPVVGRFDGDVGDFVSDEEFEGRPIRCRYRWTRTNPETPRWEQAFSTDGGATWETNWIADFRRVG